MTRTSSRTASVGWPRGSSIRELRPGPRKRARYGKALRLRDTLELDTPSGERLLKIQEKKLSVTKKALVGLRDRFPSDLASGGEVKATGNILDLEYLRA